MFTGKVEHKNHMLRTFQMGIKALVGMAPLVLCTERLLIRFLARAHAWILGSIPEGGHAGDS